jgi:hypothetical protein
LAARAKNILILNNMNSSIGEYVWWQRLVSTYERVAINGGKRAVNTKRKS